jgi:threonine/homoserine/homoserine lactone efflux protein
LAGFLINTLNPSVFLFWLINATAFAASHDLTERILIFGVCLLVNVAADVAKVMMAGGIRNRLNTGNIRLINRVSGTILVVFGIALLYGTMALKHKNP